MFYIGSTLVWRKHVQELQHKSLKTFHAPMAKNYHNVRETNTKTNLHNDGEKLS